NRVHRTLATRSVAS
ncbi:unnamed protein product, partial [Callosobruchus maculatus]